MVLNATINETVTNATNATSLMDKAASAASTASSVIPLVFSRLWDLVAAPFRNQEMLWIVFPLFFTLIILEFYFDRHGDEELGWGAAVANSLVLIFVAIDLIKQAFHYDTPWNVLKTVTLSIFTEQTLPIHPQVLILILFIGALGLATTLINYYHLLPRKIAFIISSHPPINFLAYFAIAIVYSTGTSNPIPFDIPTLVAGAILFVIILIVVFFVKKSISNFIGGTGRNNGPFSR